MVIIDNTTVAINILAIMAKLNTDITTIIIRMYLFFRLYFNKAFIFYFLLLV